MEQDEIIDKYNMTLQDGKEPIRLLKNIDDIQAWSNIPDYMAMLLTQLKLLNDELETKIIEEKIIKGYLEFSLSKNGYAREQFRVAHTGMLDTILPKLAGITPDEENNLRRK